MARTIYITDAVTPLGRAAAVRLGRAGWNLVLGGSSLSNLQGLCAELPDQATLPKRCDARDPANIVAVLDAAEARFGGLDAVLFNNRAPYAGWKRALNTQIAALALSADACAPLLERARGRFVVVSPRRGTGGTHDVLNTVVRDAMHTLTQALDADWREDERSALMIEPKPVDTPQDMARRIARALNGAPLDPRRAPAATARAL